MGAAYVGARRLKYQCSDLGVFSRTLLMAQFMAAGRRELFSSLLLYEPIIFDLKSDDLGREEHALGRLSRVACARLIPNMVVRVAMVAATSLQVQEPTQGDRKLRTKVAFRNMG